MTSGAGHRWSVLAVSTAAQAATATYFLGLAAVTPALRAYFGLSLPEVGALIGVTSVGILAALIPWGSAADRFGERPLLVIGLAGAAAFLGVAATQRNPVVVGALLVAAGASGASVNSASGRAVLLWFPASQRGMAMAVRQTSVPLGAALAAATLPAVAGIGGVPAVFAALSGFAALVAIASAIWVRDAPHTASAGPARTGNARDAVRATLADRRLWRISLAAGLLVVPQFLGSVFLVELLHTGHGMALATAALLLSITQLLGAAGRLGAGYVSDRVGSRLRPLRVVAVATAAGFALAAVIDLVIGSDGPAGLLAVVLVPAAALGICWNGLAFTATSEMVPRSRVGTALAFENTANYLSAAGTPVLGGVVAALLGWPAMLTVGTLAAMAAWTLLGSLAAHERTGWASTSRSGE